MPKKIIKEGVEFCSESGTLLLIRCPKCGKENYALQVSSGICSWCGFDGRELFEEEDTKK